jgi:hypothetical protein
METKKESIKEDWTEPDIYSIDFRETRGGDSDAAENDFGNLSSLPGEQ